MEKLGHGAFARIPAVTRRAKGDQLTQVSAGDLTVNLVTREARRGAMRIELTAREFSLLELLMRSPGRVYTRTQILEHVWGHDFDPQTNVVDVCIRRLRNKIDLPDDQEPLIETVRNVGYRLHLTTPQPDFELRDVPSAINARAGTTVPVTVHVLRRDGFAGEVALALKDAPTGFELAGARIPADQDMVRMTLSAPALAPSTPFRFSVIGLANIRQREVIRAAVPADDLMQAFIYRHLVAAGELLACVLGPPQPFAPEVPGAKVVRIPVGG